MASNKKSPLTSSPLRVPGQSLDEHIDNVLNDEGLIYIFMPIFCVVLTCLEWWRWYAELPYSPYLYSFLAGIVILFSAYKISRLKKKLKKLRLGRDGERVVGQYLELLREKGYRVFHDIVGDGFNVDHIIISTHGVFVIETKTYSKPSKGKPIIKHENDSIVVDGFNTSTKTLNQVAAASSWVESVINETTGRKIAVKPVVVFPGWFIETKNNKNDIWVLNPKALPTYIENTPDILSKEDMMLFSYHISRYIRTC